MARPGRRERCLRCEIGEDHEFKHGITGYKYHGCRCTDCRVAKSETDRCRRGRMSAEDKRASRRREYLARRVTAIEYSKKYYAENRDSLRDAQQDYYDSNRHRIVATANAYRASSAGTATALRRQAKLARAPRSRNRSRWTVAEDELVLSPGLTILELSYMLSRSPSAVKSRRVTLSGMRRSRSAT